MAWLVSSGHVLASAEVAVGRRAAARGLLGRDGVDGVYVIPHCRWVHTIGMRFPIDVAHLGEDGTVLRITRMARWRLGRPVRHCHTVIEAEAGAFGRWELRVGDVVEIRE